ncbi:MAG: hypothetical protein IPK16_23105 [Anaerolineales bacterium]|nr:hypothetical protein [Anaerolineales bacterium]
MIKGETPAARSKNAAQLADRIGADMVIYGYLTPEDDAESLTLEFYYAAPVRAGDPDATTGAHEIGTPIRSEVSAASNESTAKRQLSGPLAQRAAALFWLTQGLSYDLANDPDTALKILQEAEQKLTDWKDDEGKEVLYLFLARAAMWARQYDIAIRAAERAISINPNYANAYGVLGTALMDRAQLFYIRGRTLTPEEQACISTANIDNAAETVEEAADNARAIAVLEDGLHAAPQAHWPPVEHYLRLILGLAYRLEAQDDIFAGNFGAAEPSLDRAKAEFEDALTYFSQENYPALYASTVAGLAATHRYWAHLRIVDATMSPDPATANGDRKEAAAFLQQTIDGYQACLDQQQRTRGNPIFQKRVLKCSCIPYQAEARNTLASLGDTP